MFYRKNGLFKPNPRSALPSDVVRKGHTSVPLAFSCLTTYPENHGRILKNLLAKAVFISAVNLPEFRFSLASGLLLDFCKIIAQNASRWLTRLFA
ncbi:MAG: hypothetical protein ACI4HK_06520 [Ruminococcus sp.]